MEDDEVASQADLMAAFGGYRREGAAGKSGKRRPATSSTKCYNCGQYGHYKSDCPLRKTSVPRQATRTSRVPSSGCLICHGNHFARDCSQLQTARQLLEQHNRKPADGAEQSVLLKAPPRASTSADPKVQFREGGTGVICQVGRSPIRVRDPALPMMGEESTPGSARMQLFFVLGAIQTLPVWILADSGSVRNLIDEAVYRRLPFQPPMQEPGDVQVIGGNG